MCNDTKIGISCSDTLIAADVNTELFENKFIDSILLRPVIK